MYLLISLDLLTQVNLPIIGRSCAYWFTNDDLAKWDAGVSVHFHDGSRRPILSRFEYE
jgi:hypothetical protein